MGTAPKAIADTLGATNYQDPINYPGAWPTVWTPYTVNGVGIVDPTGNADGTKGAQPAQSGDIAPCSGGSVFFSRDTNNLYFRLCVDADPYENNVSTGPYVSSSSWALLIDVNGDGFREFAVFLDGKAGQGYDKSTDNLYVVYKSNLNQGFTSDDLEVSTGGGSTAPGSAVLWVQDSAIGSPIRQTPVEGETGWETLTRDLSRTRSVVRGDKTYYLDIQVPLAALDATAKGGPKVMFSTPISFVFSTANSNTDPYQKDIAMPGTFDPTATVPLPFGDIVTGNTTYPQPAIPTVTAGTCSATNTLSATVIDSLSITSSSTVGTSLTSVKFFYQFDSDGDGQPALSGSWTFLGNGSLPATTPATTNPWSVTWNSTLLPSGRYFIKAVAVDNAGYTTDSVDAIDDAGANTTAGGDTFNPGTLQITPVSPIFANFSNTCGTKPPTIDLDGDNSSGATGNDFRTTYTLAGSAVSIVDANTLTTETLDTVITDADSTQLSRAVVALTNAQTGDSLSISGSLPTGISLDPSSTATRIVLTGSVALASYETALEQIRFSSTSANLSDRTVTVQVTDTTSLASNVATATIKIAASTDYSDAPISGIAPSGTGTNNYGDATHNIVGSLKLGTNIDSETASIANATASGDGADDDGIITLPNLTAGATRYSIPAGNIVATNTSGTSATLHAWVDFNKNGTFESNEYTSTTVNTGTNGGNPTAGLTWNGITVGAVGNTFVRFRLTTDSSVTSATPSGAASNGEVEDYQVSITAGVSISGEVWNDADGNGIKDTGTFNTEPNTDAVPDGNSDDLYAVLTDNAGNVLQVVPVNDTTGAYTFSNEPSNTSVKVLLSSLPVSFGSSFTASNLPTGWNATQPTASVQAFTTGNASTTGRNFGIRRVNPNIQTGFCQSTPDMMFILDDSSSVDDTEVGQQRAAVMTMLTYFVNNNIPARAAIVGFDSSKRTVIGYTAVTAANLPLFQTALNTNYGVTGSGTNWENGFQQAVALGVSAGTPDVVFFFTDGAQNSGTSPIDEADQLKAVGAHIYGIQIGNGDGITFDQFKRVTDGETTTQFNSTNNNAATADYLYVADYAALSSALTSFTGSLCPPAPPATRPNLLLVKRITAINGGTTTNGGDNLAIYKNTGSPYDDNVPETPPFSSQPNPNQQDTNYWPDPSSFLKGGTDGGMIKPDDSIEYTIYFLSTGDTPANKVTFCDRVPSNVTFIEKAFNSGIYDTSGLPTADRGIAVNLSGTLKSYTNTIDGDIASYYRPLEPLPNACKEKSTDPPLPNPNGTVVINLGNLPNATAPAQSGTYGFVRFQGRVK